jgi:hypothetical protein
MNRPLLATHAVILWTLLAGIVQAAPPAGTAETKQGIVENLQANCVACNEENMDKLLATMSCEMPNRNMFIETTRAAWQEIDTYNRLEGVEVLRESTAPHANCQYPYATALVTLTIIKFDNGQKSVFKQCEKNGAFDRDLAHQMNLDPQFETARSQMLFRHEDGQWKLIAGLTTPEPVESGEKSRGNQGGQQR